MHNSVVTGTHKHFVFCQVRIASLLIKHAGVAASDIAILTPYNAQVAKVNETLLMKHIQNVNVNTITKSQGTVILSMRHKVTVYKKYNI